MTAKQAHVFGLIVEYHRREHAPCPFSYVAQRLGRHHSTVQQYVTALHRAGFVLGASSPVTPASEIIIGPVTLRVTLPQASR